MMKKLISSMFQILLTVFKILLTNLLECTYYTRMKKKIQNCKCIKSENEILGCTGFITDLQGNDLIPNSSSNVTMTTL